MATLSSTHGSPGRWRWATEDFGKQAAFLRREFFGDFFDGLPHLFEHLQLQVIDLAHMAIIGRFVERIGAQYTEGLLACHAYLVSLRIGGRPHHLKFFPKPSLRRFGQIL